MTIHLSLIVFLPLLAGFIGLTCSPCARCPSSSSAASGTGSPKNVRKTIRNE